MKVIKAGRPKEVKPPWPVGEQFTCPHCGCEFVFEAGDPCDYTSEKKPDGRTMAMFPCPTCREQLYFERPIPGKAL